MFPLFRQEYSHDMFPLFTCCGAAPNFQVANPGPGCKLALSHCPEPPPSIPTHAQLTSSQLQQALIIDDLLVTEGRCQQVQCIRQAHHTLACRVSEAGKKSEVSNMSEMNNWPNEAAAKNTTTQMS